MKKYEKKWEKINKIKDYIKEKCEITKYKAKNMKKIKLPRHIPVTKIWLPLYSSM